MLHHAVRVRTALMAFARTSDCRANCLAKFLLGQHCCRTVCLTKRSALSGKLFGVFDTHTAPVTHHLGLLDTPVPSGGGAEGHTEREVRAPPFPNLFTCCHLPPLTSSQKCKPSRPGRRAAEAAAAPRAPAQPYRRGTFECQARHAHPAPHVGTVVLRVRNGVVPPPVFASC